MSKQILIHEADHSHSIDHYFHTDCPSVRPSVRPSQNFKIKRQCRICGLAEWIIDDSCFVSFIFLFFLRIIATFVGENVDSI